MRTWLSGILCLLSLCAGAQDVHFTQVTAQPQWLNPARAGDFFGHGRGGITSRHQWARVPVPWRTFTFGADAKLDRPLPGTDQKPGIGILLGSDRAGDLDYGQTEGRLVVALPLVSRTDWSLRAGLSGGFVQQRFDPAALRTAAQFDGDLFDPHLPTGEVWQTTSLTGLSWQAGLVIRLSPNEALSVEADLFAGAIHFGSSFLAAPPLARPLRAGIHLRPTWIVHPAFDLQTALFAQWQGPYREKIFGLMGRYWLARIQAAPVSLSGGLYYRSGDAVAPTLQLQWHAWEAGFSYDINVSPFRSATNGQGGPEWYLRYILRLVIPPPTYKGCTIF